MISFHSYTKLNLFLYHIDFILTAYGIFSYAILISFLHRFEFAFTSFLPPSYTFLGMRKRCNKEPKMMYERPQNDVRKSWKKWKSKMKKALFATNIDLISKEESRDNQGRKQR